MSKTRGILTPEFRMSYPNIFRAKKNELSGLDEFSVVALFAKDADLSQLKAAAEAVVVEKWGANKSNWPANLRSPFRNQNEKGKLNEAGVKVLPAGHEDGAVFMNLKSKQRPGVVDKSVQPIIDESEIYPGCWCRATVSAYAYDTKGNKGVSFGLGNIQKVKDGEPFSGRLTAEAEFAPISGAGESGSAGDLF